MSERNTSADFISVAPDSAAAPTRQRPPIVDLDQSGFANKLARATHLSPSALPHEIDRSLAPLDCEPVVQLPQTCPASCQRHSNRAAAQVEEVAMSFADLLSPETLKCMAEVGDALMVVQEPRARRGIDRALQAVVVVEPGLQDLARVQDPYELAGILATSEPRHECACYDALLSALPDDSAWTLVAQDRARPLTPEQITAAETDAERRKVRSAEWSAHIRRLQAERRASDGGDLFAAFGVPTDPITSRS